MAKILFGVHGTGYGHCYRALTVARNLKDHEIVFVSHGKIANVLKRRYPVRELPGLETVVKSHRMAYGATLLNNARKLFNRQVILAKVLSLIDEFQPDVAISDYEFFVQWGSHTAGIPCLSLDHAHILTTARLSVPFSQFHRHLADRLVIKHFYSLASHFVVVSFFRPPVKPNLPAIIIPPILRDSVLGLHAADGDHILVYKGYAEFDGFLPYLRKQPRQVRIYGCDSDAVHGNLQFMRRSEENFLEDLASCSYVICSGGHTLVSEALFYGKPIMCFSGQFFEQFVNSMYIEQLGYGMRWRSHYSNGSLIERFESRLEEFRDRIRTGTFVGNGEAIELVNRFIRNKAL